MGSMERFQGAKMINKPPPFVIHENEFLALCKPVSEYIAKNYSLDTYVIISGKQVKLLEAVAYGKEENHEEK